MGDSGDSAAYYAEVFVRRGRDRLTLRHFPLGLGTGLTLILLFALGNILSGTCLGIAGPAFLAAALIALLLVELRTCTFDRVGGTITFERLGFRRRTRDERLLADLAAVGVKVVNRGGCYVTLHLVSGELVQLFGEPLWSDGAKAAAEIHDFLKLETPLRVES